MPLDLDFRNTNSLWCSVLVETLARRGLGHAVISPGSRSTPLTIALVRHGLVETIPVLDERSAGFLALGLAKRTHLPVALVCTSGTAVANYLPAVIEASESGTSLLVLTADRPPEMRACASGQTIDQQKIFGDFVRFFHEVAVPESRMEMLAYLRQTAASAWDRALGPSAGPVHLNFPFRDPLPPLPDASASGVADQLGEAFFSHLDAGVPHGRSARVWQRPTTSRGLIVAGPANPPDLPAYLSTMKAFSERLNWPVLADALSPLRHQEDWGVPVIAHYDAILRDSRAAQALVPRTVVCLDDWPTSKVLRTWLSGSQAEIAMVSNLGMNRDALHGRARQLPFGAEALAAEGSAPADEAFVNAWRTVSASAAAAVDEAFESIDDMFEPKAAWLLARLLPQETAVFVASSMPVRDVEYFWPRTAKRFRFFFNRGANGIDGTLSAAIGIAHGGAPAVLVTGDLALLHDSNGLLLAGKLKGSLRVVLINNHGGGIFEHLPVAQFDPPFEEYFATPQSVDFGALCAAHGVRHRVADDWQSFSGLLAGAASPGIEVVEIRTDRKADAGRRKRLLADVAKRAAAALH
ncbi:MAG TPA: 2-succinyl-5-enolpyruvyl-6-hydroxy-3-cyclohexene-1-carboxylic-acid synthase [Opitutaceae bacterium]